MGGPAPYPLAIVLCDSVLEDSSTQKRSLMGLFDEVRYHSLPTNHPMTLFLRFTDAEGAYDIKLQYVHLNTDRLLHEETFHLDVPNRLGVNNITFKLVVGIDQPGMYEIRVFADEAYLARTWFGANPQQ